MTHITRKVHFKDSSISSPYEFFHWFAENIIFMRWSYFKNRPRSTFLLLRSVLVSTLVFGIYYTIFSNIQFLLMGIEVDPVLLYCASITLGYWTMHYSFSQKANYLSLLYNEYIVSSTAHDPSRALILKCNFAIQLLTIDMWGHRLYSWVLAEILEDSIKHHFSDNFDMQINKVNLGKYSVSEARECILSYQRFLMQRRDKDDLRHAA